MPAAPPPAAACSATAEINRGSAQHFLPTVFAGNSKPQSGCCKPFTEVGSCRVTTIRGTLQVQTYLKRKRSSWSAAATAARQSPAATASAASAFSTVPISVLRTVCVAAGAGEICGVPASTLAVPFAKRGLSPTVAAAPPCRHRAMSRRFQRIGFTFVHMLFTAAVPACVRTSSCRGSCVWYESHCHLLGACL